MKMFCYRCKRTFLPGESFDKVWLDGGMRPCCRDGRQCRWTSCKAKSKKRKQKKN